MNFGQDAQHFQRHREPLSQEKSRVALELDVAALARGQSANVVGRRTAGNGVCHSRTHELHCIDAGAALEALASTLRTASTFAEPRVRTQSHASASKILHHEVAEVGFDASGLNRAQGPPGGPQQRLYEPVLL